ncbi:hypothetical protein JKF63_03302 [Porcisia hertigi]|uniref:Uncharacterized protein n=1 Tax=Porcisia hertigi TaxID=2761500 RepID=A0A836LH94_9TRYP|nr:hypothetical protein JKF63_03302 [Porcisia hertigi]
MSSASVYEMSRQLVLLDNQAKAIRSEVEFLRATKRSLEVSAANETKMLEVRESMGSTNNSMPRRSRALTQSEGTAGGSIIELPRDFLDDLSQKCGEVGASVRAHNELRRDKKLLQDALALAEERAHEAEQEYVYAAEIAGLDEKGTSRSAAGSKKKNAYDSALKSTAEAYRQRENARVQLEDQSRELLRLAAVLQETTDADSQRAEAVEALAERKAKLAALRHECDVIARATARRDQIAEKGQHGLTSEDYIRHSNFDRQVALHGLHKEDNLIKQNDLAIRYRAMQISKIQTRLELIGDAVIGDGMEGEERVDAEIVEELAKEINHLYDSHLLANIRMDSIDCDIEKMVWRAGALQHARDSAVVEMKRFYRDHQRYLDKLQKTLDKERISNGRTATKLQDEIDALHMSSARKAH